MNLTAELNAPWSLKPSSLIGDMITVKRLGNDPAYFTIIRAYTLKKFPWGRKTIRVVASERECTV